MKSSIVAAYGAYSSSFNLVVGLAGRTEPIGLTGTALLIYLIQFPPVELGPLA